MSDLPLVSCLMVTLPTPQRVAFAKKAIAAYCAQTYPNKELVIIQDAGAKSALQRHVAQLGRDDIHIHSGAAGMTLGALRNLSRRVAKGAFACQWDDDDLHHGDRVAQQVTALQASGALAIGLRDILQFFPKDRALFWTNWLKAPPTIFPGTLMFRADAPISYPEDGSEARRGEDSAVCEQLLALNGLAALPDAPHLSIYMSHGANTWDDGHHAMLVESLGVSHGLLRRRQDWLRKVIGEADLGPGLITVRGPAGVAFTIDADGAPADPEAQP